MKKALWAIGIFIFSLIVTSALFVFNVFLLVFMLYPLTLVSSALTASGMIRLCKKNLWKTRHKGIDILAVGFSAAAYCRGGGCRCDMDRCRSAEYVGDV